MCKQAGLASRGGLLSARTCRPPRAAWDNPLRPPQLWGPPAWLPAVDAVRPALTALLDRDLGREQLQTLK